MSWLEKAYEIAQTEIWSENGMPKSSKSIIHIHIAIHLKIGFQVQF